MINAFLFMLCFCNQKDPCAVVHERRRKAGIGYPGCESQPIPKGRMKKARCARPEAVDSITKSILFEESIPVNKMLIPTHPDDG